MKNKPVFRVLTLSLTVCLLLLSVSGCHLFQKEDGGDMTSSVSPTPTLSPESPAEVLWRTAAEKQSDNENPVAVFVLSTGKTVTAELYPDVAPNTVNNFISLANSGFYDGLTFHRVIDGFMIQGGDPEGNGTGGPGYTIDGEFTNNGFQNDLKHTPGVLSMARQGSQKDPASKYNTAGSQFFICVATVASLDRDYAAFGMVVDGMEAVYEIAATATGPNDKPLTDQVMTYVRVDTHGVDYPAPKKTGETEEPTTKAPEAATRPSTSPSGGVPYISDNARLLSSANLTNLSLLAAQRSAVTGWPILVLTEQDVGEKKPADFVSDFFAKNPVGVDYAVLLLCPARGVAEILSSGAAQTALPSQKLIAVKSAILPQLNAGDIAGGVYAYILAVSGAELPTAATTG